MADGAVDFQDAVPIESRCGLEPTPRKNPVDQLVERYLLQLPDAVLEITSVDRRAEGESNATAFLIGYAEFSHRSKTLDDCHDGTVRPLED